MQRERQELLDRDPEPADQRRDARPLEVLEHEVRPLAVEHRVERADDRGVGQPFERARLELDPTRASGSPTSAGRRIFATTSACSASSQARYAS